MQYGRASKLLFALTVVGTTLAFAVPASADPWGADRHEVPTHVSPDLGDRATIATETARAATLDARESYTSRAGREAALASVGSDAIRDDRLHSSTPSSPSPVAAASDRTLEWRQLSLGFGVGALFVIGLQMTLRMRAGRRITWLAMLTAAASIVAVAVQPASASDAVPVAGAFTVTDVGSIDCAPTGSAPFLFRCETTGLVSRYTGSMSGISTTDFTQLVNCATGRTQGSGTETFDGSVEGVGSGTLTWRIHFESAFDCSTFTVAEFAGRGAITTGTGALGAVNGLLEFDDDTYEGGLH